jgi:drug/metabolite transporter (DMT)-like permease
LLLAVFAAIFYGLSDFLAGVCSRTAGSVVSVAFVVQAAAVAPAVALALSRPAAPTAQAVALGSLAGVGLAVGSGSLYLGLARGAMGVVAPTSAIVSAALPALVAVALRETFGGLPILGICLAGPALLLVAAPSERAQEPHGAKWRLADLGYGTAAGAGIGTSYLAFGAYHGQGLWTVPISLVLSTLLFGALLLRPGSGTSFALSWWTALGAGVSLGLACAAFRLSVTESSVAISSVVTSLYPAVTVLLAALVLKESMGPVRRVGLLMALGSIGLVAHG